MTFIGIYYFIGVVLSIMSLSKQEVQNYIYELMVGESLRFKIIVSVITVLVAPWIAPAGTVFTIIYGLINR